MSRRKETREEPVETIETAEKAVEAAETEPAAEQPVPVCYVGPTIPGILQHATIYNYGLPDMITEAMAECPAIRGLLIPVADMPVAYAISDNNGPVAALGREVIKWAAKKEV